MKEYLILVIISVIVIYKLYIDYVPKKKKPILKKPIIKKKKIIKKNIVVEDINFDPIIQNLNKENFEVINDDELFIDYDTYANGLDLNNFLEKDECNITNDINHYRKNQKDYEGFDIANVYNDLVDCYKPHKKYDNKPKYNDLDAPIEVFN